MSVSRASPPPPSDSDVVCRRRGLDAQWRCGSLSQRLAAVPASTLGVCGAVESRCWSDGSVCALIWRWPVGNLHNSARKGKWTTFRRTEAFCVRRRKRNNMSDGMKFRPLLLLMLMLTSTTEAAGDRSTLVKLSRLVSEIQHPWTKQPQKGQSSWT